jgi:hypothetical protein
MSEGHGERSHPGGQLVYVVTAHGAVVPSCLSHMHSSTHQRMLHWHAGDSNPSVSQIVLSNERQALAQDSLASGGGAGAGGDIGAGGSV